MNIHIQPSASSDHPVTLSPCYPVTPSPCHPAWATGWRQAVWSQLNQTWDVLIIGGGITGAGVLREAARLGLRALLVERNDFGWGTSSRSSKLVHGGLRYLKEGRLGLTMASVQERERLLEEAPGLIDPLGFLLATYKGDQPGRLTYEAGLSVYDLLALQWSHRAYSARDFEMLAPHISRHGLEGGLRYGDAQTDDARLVLRVIREAVADGGLALNYAAVQTLLRRDGQVVGARLRDQAAAGDEDRLVAGDDVSDLADAPTGEVDVYARVVINATGAWADCLRRQIEAQPRIRPLRGSHLVFPAWRLPVAQAISFLHPLDRRPVFIFPWEGISLVGTTDIDHTQPLEAESPLGLKPRFGLEPHISPDEVAYLMAAVAAHFPALNLSLDDVIATLAGVRPVIGSGKANPSEESRDHVVWDESGLLTVTGGKLTTFRLIALDALKAARARCPDWPPLNGKMPVLAVLDVALPGGECLDEAQRRRLLGRYGADAPALTAAAQAGELERIPGTLNVWAELRWAARAEGVVHLDDLLLRRVRLGLLLPEGGRALLPRIRAICQPELGWDDARWQAEEAAYLALWQRCYSLPDRAAIPDWNVLLTEARSARQAAHAASRRRLVAGVALAAGLAGLVVGLLAFWRRPRHEKSRQGNRILSQTCHSERAQRAKNLGW